MKTACLLDIVKPQLTHCGLEHKMHASLYRAGTTTFLVPHLLCSCAVQIFLILPKALCVTVSQTKRKTGLDYVKPPAPTNTGHCKYH